MESANIVIKERKIIKPKKKQESIEEIKKEIIEIDCCKKCRRGKRGKKGKTGPTGCTGYTGEAGSSTTGPTGANGTSFTGPTGSFSADQTINSITVGTTGGTASALNYYENLTLPDVVFSWGAYTGTANLYLTRIDTTVILMISNLGIEVTGAVNSNITATNVLPARFQPLVASTFITHARVDLTNETLAIVNVSGADITYSNFDTTTSATTTFSGNDRILIDSAFFNYPR